MDRALEDRKGRAHNRELAGRADFGDINWAHYTHPQLYDMVHTADLDYVRHQATEWRQVAAGIEETTDVVRRTLSDLFATWQGGAADTARAANDQLTRWADQMTRRTDKIADRLSDYHEALGAARQAMPPPEFAWAENAFINGGSPKMMNGPSGEIEIQQFMDDQKPNFEKHHAAWQEAVRVMQTYGQQSQVAHDRLPEHYEPAPQTTVEPGPPVIPDWPDVPVPPPPPWPPRPVDKPGDSGVPGDIDGDGIPDGTTPGGYTNPVGGGSGTGYGPGYGPGGIAGPGSGADIGRGGFGGGGMPGAGPLAARAGGAAGASAYPPFGAGGAGARREEDAEHKDKYAEPTDFFDDLPPAYPQVFGA